MSASARTQYTLERVDDPATPYVIESDGVRIGEIRHLSMHDATLHLDDLRLILRRDEVAAIAARGGGLLRRLVESLRFNRRYSLRDGEQILASAQRHWNPLRSRDCLDLLLPGDPRVFRATPRGMFDGTIDFVCDGRPAGDLRVVGLLQHRVSLENTSLPAPIAAFLMTVVHKVWGNNPNAGGSDA